MMKGLDLSHTLKITYLQKALATISSSEDLTAEKQGMIAGLALAR